MTSDKRVWFRKGISPGGGEEGAVGAGWVEMVGSMSQISVASNDQVINIYNRCDKTLNRTILTKPVMY